jgi:excisionase family DNA binding protein
VSSDNPLPACGLTPRQVAAYLRLSRDRVCGMIRRGELGAIDTGTRGRPRWIILPCHVEAWERAHRAAVAQPKPRRRRQPPEEDFFPDL